MAIENLAKLTSKITHSSGEAVEVTNFSNKHIANNMEIDFVIKKEVNKDWALPKDVLQITTTVTNNAQFNISDINILDTLSEGASFVDGSVQIGTQKYPDFNPIAGFDFATTIGALGGEFVMTYQIKIEEFPNVDNILNKSTISFEVNSKQFAINSNEIKILIVNNDVKLLKTANTFAVKSGDIITYTISIANDGTILNTNLFFQDNIPIGTTFVENSVKIDGEAKNNYNPQTGFELNNLNAGNTIEVEFKVKVD